MRRYLPLKNAEITLFSAKIQRSQHLNVARLQKQKRKSMRLGFYDVIKEDK